MGAGPGGLRSTRTWTGISGSREGDTKVLEITEREMELP
jgi:hypothetical protein